MQAQRERNNKLSPIVVIVVLPIWNRKIWIVEVQRNSHIQIVGFIILGGSKDCISFKLKIKNTIDLHNFTFPFDRVFEQVSQRHDYFRFCWLAIFTDTT